MASRTGKHDYVKLHIDIALNRGNGLEQEVVEELFKINEETSGIAVVGNKTPVIEILLTCPGMIIDLVAGFI